MERQLADRPGLAAACEHAARAVLGECETEPLDEEEYVHLVRQHDATRIRSVRPVGRPPHPSAEGGGGSHNTLSGTTVHGSTVQAGNIDALHFHVHGDGDAASRRPGRGVAAWLRGRLWHGGG
ncbi:MAG TPA: hypothetical protein VFH94_02585 [Streptomyces sp.]|nr:hypothetical protein [Streptomyces sp.]